MAKRTPRRLAIYGAGGCGRLVADVAEASGWTVDFFDDLWPGLRVSGPWPVVGDKRSLVSSLAAYDGVVVAIGECSSRLRAYRDLQAAGTSYFPVLVHPTAWVSPHAVLGPGCVVMANAAVCVGAILNEACYVSTGATVSHDCELGAGVHVSPGARLAGTVTVDEGAWIGLGAAVKQGIRVGKRAIVGAGAVVVRDVDHETCVVGCPAKPMQHSTLKVP